MIRGQLRPAILLTLVLCVITGLVYPGVVTGLAQLIFPAQANGSLVTVNGKIVGSALIGQSFTRAEYFHSRPSAAGSGYDAAASSGTNKGPVDRKLADTLVGLRVDSSMADMGIARGAVPSDLVTASASGLDPHISPANSQVQVSRVARARGADSTAVRGVVDAHTDGRQFGVFGEPRVNVLLLNIAIDSLFPMRTATSAAPAPSPTTR